MTISRRLLLKNLVMGALGMFSILLAYVPFRTNKLHLELLIIGIFLLGWSGDGFLNWFGGGDRMGFKKDK